MLLNRGTFEVMDGIFSIFFALMHWRFLLSLVGSIAFAALLSSFMASFTAGYCIALVILGAAFGAYWQVRGEAGISLSSKIEEPRISRSVSFLGLTVIGFFFGGALGTLLDSFALGAVGLMIGVMLIGLLSTFVLKRAIPRSSLLFSAVSLLAGYGVLGILLFLNGH